MSDEVTFFGSVDRNRDGKIASAMPAWYFDQFIEELEESIARKERSIKRGEIPASEIQYAREELKRETARLQEIMDSKPKLSGQLKDKVAKAYKLLGEHIADTLPSRSDELLGFASPHEELKKMKSPCIPINHEIAKMCGLKTVRGRITRDQAVTAYKMMGKALDDNTNVERLRKDGKFGTFRSMDEMTEMILKKFQGK